VVALTILTIVNTSASPDGLLRGENAVLEIKCPTHITHAKNLMSETMPKNYIYQVHVANRLYRI
jgi:hypothetical protein